MNRVQKNSTSLAVNTRFISQKITGTQRFASNIARELKKMRPETLFLAPPAINNPQLAAELEVRVIGAKNYRLYQKLNLPANPLWEQIDLPLYLWRHGNPGLLNLINLAPYFYKNNIITIHDLCFKLYPEFFSRKFTTLYNFLVPRLARRARHIITVSQHSKSDICEHFLIPPEKVTIAGNAVNFEDAGSNQTSPYPEPYILAVGALEPRKNIPNLIAAFRKLPERNLRLVIVGKNDLHVFRQTQERLCNSGATEDKRVIFTGYLDDHKLTTLYRHAIGFCYPSFYEGFGLPPLEAQAQGCPVIVSRRASLPEVFGDSALYCDPENIDNIAHMLQILIDDQDLRERLKLAGLKNCRRFSWRQSTEKIVTAIFKSSSNKNNHR